MLRQRAEILQHRAEHIAAGYAIPASGCSTTGIRLQVRVLHRQRQLIRSYGISWLTPSRPSRWKCRDRAAAPQRGQQD